MLKRMVLEAALSGADGGVIVLEAEGHGLPWKTRVRLMPPP